jgi:elongation factor Ts
MVGLAGAASAQLVACVCAAFIDVSSPEQQPSHPPSLTLPVMRSAHLLRRACVPAAASAASSSSTGVHAAISRCVVQPIAAAGGRRRAPLCSVHRTFSSAGAAPVKASTAQIKSLRESSGAPITECRDALQGVLNSGSTDGSEPAVMQAAVEWLRKKGISTAAKKSGRAASEGLVSLYVSKDGTAAAMVELNSETDFAARNTTFRQLIASIGTTAGELASSGQVVSLPAVSAAQPAGSATGAATIATAVTDAVTSLRENLQLRRVAGVKVTQGVVGTYVHNAVDLSEAGLASDVAEHLRMGRQGALIGISASGTLSAENRCSLSGLANKLAMQIVASTPRFLRRADVPTEVIENERAVLTEQAHAPPVHVPGQPAKKSTGKPKDPKQVAKMVEGRLNKWLGEIVLEEQPIVVSGEGWDLSKAPTVGQVVKSASERYGAPLEIVAMERFLVGEGVQKQDKGADAFAKEVAEKIAKAK